jgi:hypothetical protein
MDRLKIYSLLSVALLISSGPLISANIPAIEKEFTTVNPTHVGLLITTPSLFVILGILVANRLELWIGKKRTILIGLTQVTPLLLEKHIGNATVGSNNLAFIGLGAFIAGFSFGRIFQLLKVYIMPVALLFLGISIYITTISESIVLTTFCSMAIGFSFRCMMPYLFHTFTQQRSI